MLISAIRRLGSVALPLLAAPTLAFAHAGGLDQNGCHQNKAKQVYECHQGPLKGQTFKSKAEAEAKLRETRGISAAKPAEQAAKLPGHGTSGHSAPH